MERSDENNEAMKEDLKRKHTEAWLNTTKAMLMDANAEISIKFVIEILQGICDSFKEDLEQEKQGLTEWGLGYRECNVWCYVPFGNTKHRIIKL